MTNTYNKYLSPKILSVSIPLYLFFLLHHLAVPITGNSPTSFYTPHDNIALDCGNSGNITGRDGRVWIGDVNTRYSPFEPQSNTYKSTISRALKQPSSSTSPYMTARFSYSEFTYMFSLSAGQKFIRLHFYPSPSYPNFDPSKAFFSVTAGPYTLLNNFSAALTRDANHVETIVKEFCVNVDEENQRINITFTPSQGNSDAFAFINGIEIVSMPTNLYHSPADDEEIMLVGPRTFMTIENSTALEMVYRVNIGGSFINPVDDTGMFRSWDKEDDYLTEPGSSVLPTNTSIKLSYKVKPNYSAPADVYTTARTMGLNKTINKKYYLTWSFPVDSAFTYLLRLHFCEFQIEITKAGDRVFEIYIANQTAETRADVFVWTGDQGNGIPVYRDYLVIIGTKQGYEKQNLSIALHTAPEWKTEFSDAILNGVEIFKLNQSNGNLAGPNPPVLLSPPAVSPPSQESTKHNNNQTKKIAIVVGVVSGFVVLSVIGFQIFRRKMTVKDSGSRDGASWWGPVSYTTKSTKSRCSHLPSDLSRHFSLAEIKAATNNFDSVFIIGVGGFGNVYKGFIDGGRTSVAIKRLNPGSQQGALEFKTEIEMLSKLRHLHLVSLIGYCNDDREMILVYDYMSRGTLRDHLYNNDNPPLAWNQRLQICIGAARGLHYLHTGAEHTIIHRDVKTTNILLDEKWVAKVSDFGLSKMGPTNMSQSYVSTEVKGSLGYLDPEYYRRQQLTEKSDVYSFGVVLLEVLCAKPPITRMVDKKQVTLAEWARQCYCKGTLDQIIDPFLRGKIAPECLKKFSEVAMSCLHDDGIERPSMSDVVWGLEFVLELQEGAEERQIKLGGAHIEIEVDKEAPFREYTTDNSCDLFSSLGEHVLDSRNTSTVTITTSDDQSLDSKDSDGLVSGAIFSEIKNPQGR